MIQKIAYINDECIYQNKNFWLDEEKIVDITNNFDKYTVLDYMKKPITDVATFTTAYMYIKPQIEYVISMNNRETEMQRNIYLGAEIISLFRSEFMAVKPNMSSKDLGLKCAGLITLLLSGCFKEAAEELDIIPKDEFLTDELVTRYKELITTADAITYEQSETEQNV